MLKVYGYPNTRSLRVTWMLAELGQDYEYIPVDLMQGEGQTPEYKAVNPAGKVPALVDGDLLLTESGAILTYLGDRFARRDLVPEPGTPARGKYEQWCYFATGELEQPLWTMAKHTFAIPADYRVKEVLPTAKWELNKALKLFSNALAGQDYILGDQFTAADILLGHCLFWALAIEQAVEHPNLQDYVARLRNRPALRQARAREQAAIETA